MAKGSNVPEGVRYFDYQAAGNKGKFHPAEVNAGQSGAKYISGNQPAIGKPAAGSTHARPAGVSAHSGTEDMGSKPSSKATKRSGPTAAKGAEAKPAGVRSFSGGKV